MNEKPKIGEPEALLDQEWIKQKIEGASDAINGLYEMSVRNDTQESVLKKYYDAINDGLGSLQDRLLEGTREEFFETLELANKLVRVYKNYSSAKAVGWFYHRNLRDLSSGASYILAFGIKRAQESEDILENLKHKEVDSLFASLELLLMADSDYMIDTAIRFFEGNNAKLSAAHSGLEADTIAKKIKQIQDLMNSFEFEENLGYAVTSGLQLRKKIEYCEKQLRNIFLKYGLDPDKLLASYFTQGENGRDAPIGNNISAILELEKSVPGLSVFLFKEFGIRNFDRYPTEALVRQYEEFDTVDKPYGIVLNPTSDKNAAFSYKSEIWRSLFEQLKGKYALRFFEAESKFEAARHLVQLNQAYGEHHKISFAFIGGHGTAKSINFGGHRRRNLLLFEDLAGRGVKRSGRFFDKHPVIILISCSTGQEGGIGQELSKVLNAKVIAPKIPTNINAIKVIPGEPIDFEISFKLKEGQDVAQTFVQGKGL